MIFFSIYFGQTKVAVENYKEGIVNYQNGEFDKALDNFLLAYSKGLKHPDLFYNIGNSYYKYKDIPNAILYYKKALKLNSTHKLAKQNLAYLLTITRDSQIQENENSFQHFIKNIYFYFSINTSTLITFIFLFLIILLIHYMWFSKNIDKTFFRFINFILIFCFIISLSITVSRIMINNKEEAVLIKNSVVVYSGPDESFEKFFTINEGSIITIEQVENKWTRMTTLSGFSGWINSDSYKIID
jgi:tetratricopeptide (TPR) repeat protein